MTEQQPTPATDDTEGHGYRRMADAERDETDDTEGHGVRIRIADAESDETDDTEGHRFRRMADAERDETDDTEGHVARSGRDTLAAGGLRPTHPKADDEEDDVAGHLSGALGSKKKTDDA